MADGEVIYEVRGDTSNLDGDLAEGESKVSSSAANLVAIGATAAAAIGTAFVAIGATAFSLADDMDQATNQIIAATGASADEAERYQSVIESISLNNYGEDFADIADNISLVNQQMGDLDDSALQSIVEKGYLMSDTFDIEIGESIRGVDAMMSQFGIDADEAYELMAQGAQNGLNQNADLADQMAEYAVYYADLGYSAEEMFNAMANGMEDGAYQLDYLNDAIKEFGIRSKDGSDTSIAAFEALGLNADEMTAAFAAGGDEAQDAFATVTAALKDCDDQVLQNEIGVNLFGTKWEDLGVDAVMALTETEGAIDSTLDALGAMEDIKYDSTSEMFEALTRQVEVLLIPLGEQLIPILAEIIETLIPVIDELLPVLTGLISDVVPIVAEIISDILPILIDLFMLLCESIMPIIEQILPLIISLIDTLLPVVMDILDAVLPLLIDVLGILLEPLFTLIEAVLPVLISLFECVAPVISALTPIITLLANLFSNVLGTEINGIFNLLEDFISIITGVILFITNVFAGNWSDAWNSIVSAFKGIFNLIPTAIESTLNNCIAVINTMISGINAITGVIGITAIPTISTVSLPKFLAGVDFVPTDDMPALLHRGEAVLTAEEADIYRDLGGKGSLERMLSASVVSSVVNDNDEQGEKDETLIINLLNIIISKLEELSSLSITMDKEKVGKLVAPTVNKQLGTITQLEERGKF